ncbi:VOC family protein [Jeotgalicoccus sp. S0W5]|uniref:VOC family protein n=1 Tax=Jeotgalicoccus sp. S0W5 TaxID=2527874 RepID=UPI001414D2F0|nr:VOC family protein [Jeotgalicoccus sp. S0W5]
MFKKLQSVMVYVEDVEAAKEFWTTKFDFVVKETIELPEDFKGYDLAPNEAAETTMTLFSKAFIEKYSPEVSLGTPSLMFEVENIEALYEESKTRGVEVGELVEIPGTKTFNFQDGKGNYFAVGEPVE